MPQLIVDDAIIVEILKNKDETIKDRCFSYNLDSDLFIENEDEISHHITIAGYNNKIIGYIKLFSITAYVCILKDNYVGEDFEISYGYNLLAQKEFVPICNKINDLENLSELLDYKLNYENISKRFKNDYSRIMNIYYKLNPQQRWSEIQLLVKQKLINILGSEIADTPRFNSSIDIMSSNYHFTELVTEKQKDEIITNLANIIIYATCQDFIRNHNL
jgi:hypothetical protein